jgi:type IV pilus assembly protein PilO
MNISDIKELQIGDIVKWPVKTKIIAGIVLFLIVSAISWIYMISPEIKAIHRMNAQVSSLKATITNKKEEAAVLPAYQRQVKEINLRFVEFIKQLPDSAEIPSLLDDVSAQGRLHALTFKLFKPLPVAKDKYYYKIPISISITGTYNQLGGFISGVAHLPRIVNINNITLKALSMPSTGKASILPQEIQMTCVAETYKYVKGKV